MARNKDAKSAYEGLKPSEIEYQDAAVERKWAAGNAANGYHDVAEKNLRNADQCEQRGAWYQVRGQ